MLLATRTSRLSLQSHFPSFSQQHFSGLCLLTTYLFSAPCKLLGVSGSVFLGAILCSQRLTNPLCKIPGGWGMREGRNGPLVWDHICCRTINMLRFASENALVPGVKIPAVVRVSLPHQSLIERHMARICLQKTATEPPGRSSPNEKDVTTPCLLPSQRRAPKSNLWKLSLRIRRIPTMPSCFTPWPLTSFPPPVTSTPTFFPTFRPSMKPL